MTDRQRNQLAMFRTVSTYLAQHPAVWNGVTATSEAVVEFDAGIAALEEMITDQESPITGVTQDKYQLRDELEAQILAVGGAVYAFAKFTGNQTLAEMVYTTPSALDHASDQRVADVADRLFNAATPLLGDLAEYGVTQPDLDALEAARSAFATSRSAPAAASAARAGITATLPDEIRRVMGILNDRLDPLLARYKFTNATFFQGYEGSRVIVDLRGPAPVEEEEEPTPLA